MKRTLTTMLVIAATATVALAQMPPPGGPGGQGRPRGPGGPNATFHLLRMKEVQQELNLSTDQIKKIMEMQPAPGRGGPGGPPPGGPPQGGQGRPDPLADILSAGQRDRLKQLDLQFTAPASIMRPDVREALDLSAVQVEKIADILGMPPMGQPPRGGGQGGPPAGGPPQGGPPPGGPMTMDPAKRQQMMRDVMAVLTAEQRSKWGQLTGKAFTFPPPPDRRDR
ncbi:MAG: hypothetical protein ACK4XJ_11565 [Fimbriimonadaceae bacterium]